MRSFTGEADMPLEGCAAELDQRLIEQLPWRRSHGRQTLSSSALPLPTNRAASGARRLQNQPGTTGVGRGLRRQPQLDQPAVEMRRTKSTPTNRWGLRHRL